MNTHAVNNRDSLAECYRMYRNTLLSVIGNYVANRHHAEEILQDLFLKLHEHGTHLDPSHETTRGYLVVAARHLAYDHLKSRRWESRNVVHMNMDIVELDARTLHSLEDAVVDGEILSTLSEILETLPDDEKKIFIRKNVLGHTLREISKDMGITLFKVRRALDRALHRLRDGLKDYHAD